MSIPNILSIIRICLIPIFVITFFMLPKQYSYIPALILILSGITDCLDGYIARKYNLITNFGKIIDPVADKLTQLAVVISLAIRYKPLIILLFVYLSKEVIMLTGGYILIKSGIKIKSSKWFGKLSTIIFYICTIIMVLFPNLREINQLSLVIICVSSALFAFVMYIIDYIKINQKIINKEEK